MSAEGEREISQGVDVRQSREQSHWSPLAEGNGMIYAPNHPHACSTQSPTFSKYLPAEPKYKCLNNPAPSGWTALGQGALESTSQGESNGIGFEVSAWL